MSLNEIVSHRSARFRVPDHPGDWDLEGPTEVARWGRSYRAPPLLDKERNTGARYRWFELMGQHDQSDPSTMELATMSCLRFHQSPMSRRSGSGSAKSVSGKNAGGNAGKWRNQSVRGPRGNQP